MKYESQFWNERYTEHNDIYGKEPNVFFKEQLDKLSPGKLLLPGEGEGRNAMYAASKGWEVTAFDSSEVAVKKTLDNAAKAGFDMNYIHADTDSFTAEAQSFDAIGIIYFHLATEVRTAFHKKLIEWLKPGGTLILECFTPDQLNRSSGGPKNISMLYTEDILRADFNQLNITELRTLTTDLAEGSFHKGVADIIRLVANKNKL